MDICGSTTVPILSHLGRHPAGHELPFIPASQDTETCCHLDSSSAEFTAVSTIKLDRLVEHSIIIPVDNQDAGDNSMRKKLLAVAVIALAGFGVTTPASAAPKPPPNDGISPLHATCGRTGPNIENRVEADAPLSGAANQRSGTVAVSSTNCTIVGVLQPTDDALYYCYTWGNDGYSWTYLRNQRTGVRGWVRDNLLDSNGSVAHCGF